MKLSITILAILLAITIHAQIPVKVSIDNLTIVEDVLFFDIYLSKGSPTSPDIFLANADFIFQFDSDAFSNPTLVKVGPAPGYCDLLPQDPEGLNTLFTQDLYFSSTSTVLEGDRLIINLNGPAPSEESIFTRVAKIDTAEHRLGRFMMTGLLDFSRVPHLQCVASGFIQTKVFNFNTLSPFGSEATLIMPGGVSCQNVVKITKDDIPSANYQAGIELSVSGNTSSGSALSFSAGESIELLPEFSLGPNSSLEIIVSGCE